MHQLVHRLLFVLADSSGDGLRRQILSLVAENEILRGRLERRIRLTPAERARLLRLGLPPGKAIMNPIAMVACRDIHWSAIDII